MRKSRMIRLALLGSVGLVGLAACDNNDPLAGHDVIRDQKECSSKPDPDACRTALADARAQHLQTAPRFTSREDCEAQFGVNNCGTPNQILTGAPAGANDAFSGAQAAGDPGQPAPSQQQASSGGGIFMPMLMGYMMGRALGGGGPWNAQPLYRDPSNTAYSGGRPLGQLSASRFPDAPAASPNSVSRGGFGRTGSAVSSSAGS